MKPRIAISGWPTIALAMGMATGCSHPLSVQAPAGNAVGSQPLPFRQPGERGGMSPTAMLRPTSVPPGTAIVIRINSPLPGGTLAAKDFFEAVLEEPVTIDGRTLVPRGSAITGRILATNSPIAAGTPSYLHLTLSTITLNLQSLPLQTSTVFVKKPVDNEDSRFSTDRRLTFHLTQPVPLPD